jgi:hypothetical protein
VVASIIVVVVSENAVGLSGTAVIISVNVVVISGNSVVVFERFAFHLVVL